MGFRSKVALWRQKGGLLAQRNGSGVAPMALAGRIQTAFRRNESQRSLRRWAFSASRNEKVPDRKLFAIRDF
jgi:hypothetical protein